MGVMTNRQQLITRKTIAVGTIIVAVVGIGYAYYREGDAQPQVSQATELRTAAPQEIAREALAFTPAPEALRPTRPTSPLHASESKALDFEMYAASQEPRRRFHAYELAHDCAFAHLLSEPARTESWLPGRSAEPFDASACGDLKPGQWEDVQQRHALLREASLMGVHGAWFQLWQEGPNGPLRTLADGPEYRAWEAQAREAALASGDPFVYAQEAQEWHDKNPQRALVATVIYRETLTRRQLGASFDPSADPEIIELASTLDKAAAEAAIATGRAFVANLLKP